MTVTPTILDGILVSKLDDYGDGTGVRTHFAPDGTVTTETVTDLLIQAPDPVEQIAELQSQLDSVLALLAGEV